MKQTTIIGLMAIAAKAVQIKAVTNLELDQQNNDCPD